MSWSWIVCALWCLLLVAAQARADVSEPRTELILERAYWEDPSGQASFATAQQQTYTPYKVALNRGYTDSTHWIRLTLAPSSQTLKLRITPSWLDSITLYTLENPQAPVTAGDRYPAMHNAPTGLGHFFELQPSSSSRNVWLRLQTTSSTLLYTEALALDQVPQANARQILGASLYASGLLLLPLLLLPVWWMQRDQVLGLYLLRHGVYTLYGTGYLGLPALLLPSSLPPSFFDLLFSISTIAAPPLSIWFDRVLLAGHNPKRHLLALLKAIGVFGCAVVALTFLLGHTRLALQMNAMLVVGATFVVALTAFSCRPDPQAEQLLPTKIMITCYALIFCSLLIGLGSVLGWIPLHEWSLYAMVLHGLVSGLMMTIMLIVRARRMAEFNKQATWKLQQAQQNTALEQQRRHEQSQFLYMLMHELKTPLTVVSLSLGTKNNREENIHRAGRAVQDMKAIIDRCVQSDQLGHTTLAHRPQDVHAPQLLNQLLDQLAHNNPRLRSRLHISVSPTLPALRTDPQLLQIIFSNLLDNAIRYSDPLTPVSVSVQEAQQQGQSGLRVRVSNTPGLAGWPDAGQVFSKYYRANGAQRESGSGLGLYLARQLAQSLGGSLDYTPSTQCVEFSLWTPLNPV